MKSSLYAPKCLAIIPKYLMALIVVVQNRNVVMTGKPWKVQANNGYDSQIFQCASPKQEISIGNSKSSSC
jgi:hypothetical protein